MRKIPHNFRISDFFGGGFESLFSRGWWTHSLLSHRHLKLLIHFNISKRCILRCHIHRLHKDFSLVDQWMTFFFATLVYAVCLPRELEQLWIATSQNNGRVAVTRNIPPGLCPLSAKDSRMRLVRPAHPRFTRNLWVDPLKLHVMLLSNPQHGLRALKQLVVFLRFHDS